MKRYFLFSVTAALMLIWLAATWSVSLAAVSGGVVGNGTPGSCSEAAFNAALSGGGSLTFNCGAAPHTITITTRKTITADTLIDGCNLITLSGSSGVFLVPTGKSLTLQNLTLSGAASSTGSLENRGRLTLQSVMVRDNARGLNNVSGGVAIILGGLFVNNQPSGAILNQDSTLTVTYATFIANNAYNGGAIGSENNSQLYIADSTFDGNSNGNSGGGGAIYSGDGAAANIVASRFISNGLGSYGGAIYNLGVMTVTRGEFQRNRSRNSGGGITNWGTLVVQDSAFVSNTVTNGSGGGLAHFNLTMDPQGLAVSSSVFYSNTSGRDGGGISFRGGTNNWLNLTNATLSQNQSSSAPGGGGLYLSG